MKYKRKIVAEPSKGVLQLSSDLIQVIVNDGYSEHYIKQVFEDVRAKYELFNSNNIDATDIIDTQTQGNHNPFSDK